MHWLVQIGFPQFVWMDWLRNWLFFSSVEKSKLIFSILQKWQQNTLEVVYMPQFQNKCLKAKVEVIHKFYRDPISCHFNKCGFFLIFSWQIPSGHKSKDTVSWNFSHLTSLKVFFFLMCPELHPPGVFREPDSRTYRNLWHVDVLFLVFLTALDSFCFSSNYVHTVSYFHRPSRDAPVGVHPRHSPEPRA